MKAILLAALGLVLSATLATALQCGPTELVLTGLSERYKETAVGRGLMPDGSMAMVTATADGATWSLLQVQPNGQTRMMAAGTDWEAFAPTPAGEEG